MNWNWLALNLPTNANRRIFILPVSFCRHGQGLLYSYQAQKSETATEA